MNLYLKGGRVIDPACGLDAERDLLIRDGRIAAVGPALDRDGLSADIPVLDAAGLLVTPGLVDVHVHLREPGQEYSETIESGTRAAARGGFTAVCCMPNTEPPLDQPSLVRFVLDRARASGAARVYPIACISRGRRGEGLADMAELAAAGAVAFSDDGAPVASSLLMRRALEYARMLDRPIVSHSEDTVLSAGGVIHEGRVSTLRGLRGIPSASEEVAVAREVALAELTGGRLHVCHVSAAGSLDHLRRAREKGLNVTGEVTPHHLLLTDEAMLGYDTDSKMNPPLRAASDREALRRALAEGLIEVIATDHAPHMADLKNVEFDQAPFGIVGLETALGLVLTHLVKPGILGLAQAIDALATAPARAFGLPHGTLAPGALADVTLIDPRLRWSVDPSRFASRSVNTPFAGWELEGAAVGTVVEGRVVMMRGELFPDPPHSVRPPARR